MTKRDYIWVAIKVFGLYLLVEAIAALPLLLSSAIFIYQDVGTFSATDISRTLHSAQWNQFFNSLFRVIICGAFGIYFIKSGAWLLKIICPPDSDNQ
jgi:formate hydrogenlyase subunit 3/multisubunit Na+/H+ antiporter MnhD subunit